MGQLGEDSSVTRCETQAAGIIPVNISNQYILICFGLF
ncbi:hypothetical protein yrohd0001_25010 [Yersinia rohdei ATCC 43380]|nr:hypothetical protein yrohd0001_25010 [Yersinia rohdei ATCC 43380]